MGGDDVGSAAGRVGLRDWAHAAVGEPGRCTPTRSTGSTCSRSPTPTPAPTCCSPCGRPGAGRARARTSTTCRRWPAALARGALHGARGNSGVILSQILRGLADVTASRRPTGPASSPTSTAALFGAALRHAVGAGGHVDGRGGAGHHRLGAAGRRRRRRARAADGDDLAERRVTRSADAAAVALDTTPEQLDVLAEAGVVDAGGRGLLVLLDALSHDVDRPRPARSATYRARPPSTDAAARRLRRGPSVRGDVPAQRVRPARARRSCARASTSSASRWPSPASGGEPAYSVHVHADDAGAAVEAALAVGTPSRIQITSLHRRRRCAGRWAGRASGRCSPSSTATAPRSCSPARARTCCGAEPTRRSAPSSCCARSSTPAPRRSMVLPNGYVAAEELRRRLHGRHRAGASTWCRCPPGRWCRGWPRWPCTMPRARPSTTATRWPGRPRAPGTVRCGWPPRRR